MMRPAFFQSLAARLVAERPQLALEQAQAIASAVGDTPLQVGDEILTGLEGAPYRFPAAWYESAAGLDTSPPGPQ